MNSSLHFPNPETMTEYLSTHLAGLPLFQIDYFKEKKIAKSIIELAAKRFANKDQNEMAITMGAAVLIYDLQKGKDGFTGEALPNLGALGFPAFFWEEITTATEKALIDCARQGK